MNRGLWLGFVFFVALVVLGFGTLLVGDLKSLFGPSHGMQVHFEKAPGLRRGDDVRVDGVVFGKVAELKLHEPSGVLVKLRLHDKLTLWSDAEITVEAGSVLGGATVSIRRGSKEPSLDTTQVLAGRSKGGFEEIGELASENRENVRQLVQNLKDLTDALKQGKGSVGKALVTPELHDEAVAAIKELRKTGETAQTEIKKLGEHIAKITEKVDKGQGPVPALLNDKKMTEKLDKTLSEVESAASNLKSITEKVDRGEGPLGKLVNDKDMGDRLKRTVENIEQTSESIKNVSKKLEAGEGTVGKLLQDDELYVKAKQVIEDVDKTFGRAARSEVEVYANYQYFDESMMSVSRLGVKVAPSADKYFLLGAAFMGLDAEGPIRFKRQVEDGKSETEIKPELMLAYRVPWFVDGRLTLRGGMIEGKPGGAVDLRWDNWGILTHPVDFSFMARDAYNDLEDEDIDEEIRGAMMRATAKMPIWTNKSDWFQMLLSTVRVYGGVNAIDARPEWFAGIGLEWPDEDIRTLVGLFSVVR